jgi:hypothetical protein
MGWGEIRFVGFSGCIGGFRRVDMTAFRYE